MRVFVTGGAGYVGSHCVHHLTRHGHEVTVFDSLVYGHRAAVPSTVEFVQGDLADVETLRRTLSAGKFDAVIHFAAFAYVGESVHEPLIYYRNNVANTLTLLEVMREQGIKRFVFSSSCATYGEPDKVPIVEQTHQSPINPYGRTKLMVEWMLQDSARAWGLGTMALRYFNACGAARDGTIGEDHDPETHLIPLILQVALGQRENIAVFGTDYPTPDGTCVRDYVHVDDLAAAHRLAIEKIEPGVAKAYNIGTGRGYSVREVVETARKITGRPIAIRESPRRAGDPPSLVAAPALAQRDLGWKAEITTIEDIVATAWRWHVAHPKGYADKGK